MGIVDEALTEALMAGVPLPADTEDLTDIDTRKRLAREDAGLPETGPLPAKGTAQRRSYDSAMRRLQRYTTTAGQKRTVTGERLRRLLNTAGRVLALPNVAAARTSGLDMQLTASIKVSQVWKTHTMPVGEPQHISGSLLGPTLNAWVLGDMGRAGTELLAAFFTAYWGIPDPAEVGEIDSCTVTL